MTDFLGSGLRIFSADFISAFVVLMIIAVFASAFYFSKKNLASEFVQFAPTLLTSLGIFGTFFGVVLGLLDFDPNNIEGSIPLLLDGLKAAFITSLFGIFGSLIFKTLLTTRSLLSKTIQKDDSFVLGERLIETQQLQIDELRALRQALFSDDEASLFGQIKLLRIDINDNSRLSLRKAEEQFDAQQRQFKSSADNLSDKMQNFAQTLSSSATDQMIEALKKVIVGFNINLTDQFGGNFSRLNDAVKALVVWQKNHKEQLNQMCDQYSLGVKAISDTELSVACISEQSKCMKETMSGLNEVMTVNQHQLGELTRHLEAFKDMRDKAVDAVPEIRRQVEETVSDISSAVTAANTHYHQLLTESDLFIQQHAKTSEELLGRFASTTQDCIERVGERLGDSADKMGTEIEKAASSFSENTQRSNENIQNMSKYLESQTEVMFTQLKSMIAAFHEQVHDILGNMAEGAKSINVTLVEANSDLITDTKTVRNDVISTIDDMQKQLKDVIENLVLEQNRLSDVTFKSLEKQVVNQVAKTGEMVEKQVAVIDKALQEEINNAFGDMGTQLTKLTGKFTEDYCKLTEQMQRVVNQASVS